MNGTSQGGLGGEVDSLSDSSQRNGDGVESWRRSEAAFRAIIQRSPELIVVHRDGPIVYANAAVLRALGYEACDELVGRSFLDEIVEPDDLSLVVGRVLDANDARTSIPPLQVRWRCKHGGVRTTDTIAMPIEFDGEPATVVVARDITESVESQAALLSMDRMAALGTLAAGVAHEINNPLTYVLMNLENVLRHLRAIAASDDPIEALEKLDVGFYIKAITHAMDGANRVRQTVRDLTTFSQGNVEHAVLVDVRSVLESSLQMAWHEIRHRARVVKRLAEVPLVEANEAHLGQVFLNLLVNAAQAIPEGSADKHEVRLTTTVEDTGNVVVEIADTGEGIAPDLLSRIFDPFFTTNRAGARTGLGLSISHGTVKSLGGELRVTSAPGKGSAFRVVLPAAKSHRRISSSQMRAVTPRKRVLVIEEEPLVREAIVHALSNDHDVTAIAQAKEGIALMIANPSFDLVLCDLMMPVMTGMDLYIEIVRLAPQLAKRIAFMSGGVFTPRAKAFLESVSNPCLEKPLEARELRKLLAGA